MERATRLLNLLSAVIVFITGLYIQLVFEPILSLAARGLLWGVALVYLGLQIELSYAVIRRRLEGLLS